MSKRWLSLLFVLQLGAGLVLAVASAQQGPPADGAAPDPAVTAPPVMIAPAAQRGLSLPDPFRLDMLIRSTLIALNQASLELYRQLDDSWGMAQALERLGEAERCRGRSDAAATCYEESLQLSRQVGDPPLLLNQNIERAARRSEVHGLEQR